MARFDHFYKLLIGVALLLAPLCSHGFFGMFGREELEVEPREMGSWSASEIQALDRPGFRIVFPRNWTLATHQDDYDPDRNIIIDSPGESYVTISFFEAKPSDNSRQIIENMRLAFEGPLVSVISRGEFTQWGPRGGSGLHLKGHIMKYFPGGVRFFVMFEQGVGVIVTEFYYSEDLEIAMPGFELIAQSLEFKP